MHPHTVTHLQNYSIDQVTNVAATEDPGREECEERTDGIVFQHAERSVCPRSYEGFVVSCQGHGDEPHGDGAGFS